MSVSSAYATTTGMADDVKHIVQSFSTEKALAIAAYGESVASYRYRTLVNKVDDPDQQRTLTEMADEEQEHHEMIQGLITQHFPQSDFVLSAADKELVIVGTRQIHVSNKQSLSKAIDTIYESECRTGRYYAALHDSVSMDNLKPLLKEMSEECFEHAKRLQAIFHS